MSKLLASYLANPTYKKAQRIRAYERAHQMAVCMLSPAERGTLADAIYHANSGKQR